MAFSLSVLDLLTIDPGVDSTQALHNATELARKAEVLGYSRYWLGEHHNEPMFACSAPEIMIGHIAQATTHMRVGAGGVMLPNHAPLKVVENFRVLAALYPGRIDLGIGRAPGTDQMTALALRRSQAPLGNDDFPEQLAQLFAFSSGGFPNGHPFHIPNHGDSHAFFGQRGNELRRLLMFNGLDLVFHLLELLLFRDDQPLTPT